MDSELPLTPYRVLDLTNELGLLCGKMLADLGADVLAIEPPSGNTARRLGPFYQESTRPLTSLFWMAYSANKRGISLNIETKDGKALFHQMLASTDILVESFRPGYMKLQGFDYQSLHRINPSLIMVSISPFGNYGPYSHFKGPDLVTMAAGGLMYLTGDPDRPPVRISFPQACSHGGSSGAAGALTALHHRVQTGTGQHVDVSAQEGIARSLAHAPQFWDLNQEILKREGVYRAGGEGRRNRVIWPCKDGHVSFGMRGDRMPVLIERMESEGISNDILSSIDWPNLQQGELSQEHTDLAEVIIEQFFLLHTKKELWELALDLRILIYPVSTSKDLTENVQFQARGFFEEVDDPILGLKVTYPGAFAWMSSTPMRFIRPAPQLGEHNLDIYQREFGMSTQDLITLKGSGAI